MVNKKEDSPTWEDFTKHEKRIEQLEEKVGQLLLATADLNGQAVIENEPDKHSEQKGSEKKTTKATRQRTREEMSQPLQYIVLLMRNGDAEAAYAEFQALPKSELKKQPVTAATLAAAICVTRGDFDAGIKALEKVQQLTNDPRVEEIKLKLIKQAAEQKG